MEKITFDLIRKKIANGKYKTKYEHTQMYMLNEYMIRDVDNITDKEELEIVKEFNSDVKILIEKYNNIINISNNRFKFDVIEAIKNEYNYNEKQATKIYEYAQRLNHTELETVNEIPEIIRCINIVLFEN